MDARQSSSLLPGAFEELERIVGKEVPLDQFHGTVRRAVQSIRSATDYGTCLVTCSDELQGELRDGFDRDLARPLMSGMTFHKRRTFSQSNLGGRIEPGTVALVDDHFTPDVNARGASHGDRLLVIEIGAHVGRHSHGHEKTHGVVERLGRLSACCGALEMLLEPPESSAAVRYPWFEQLGSLFGEKRLEELRGMEDHLRLVPTAIVHAALQAESAVTDVLREPPASPVYVLLVTLVSVNQPGVDGALPVGYHLLRSDGTRTRVERGFSLRTTPSALAVELKSGRLHVPAGEAMEGFEAPRPLADRAEAREKAAPVDSPAVAAIHEDHRPAVASQVDHVREEVERLKKDPVAWRVYARPLLRSFFQGLTVIAPEVGLAALLFETGADWAHARHVQKIRASGPQSAEARRALRDVETEIQQLGHRDAQEVLEVLLANHSPLRA